MKPSLEVDDISKKFLIEHQQLPYLSLRDKIASPFRRKSSQEEFWALKDVSFSVQPGESLGIIGKNGAGKSTLLKILSRITLPTSGRIVVRGRIASLLEVGTGFHQELTGRENIFMNGSILGMKNSEIKSKFDEIVDFSGAEKFLDTPIKHYSSGMQLRLAFAVAAHLDPEILIIDEVLAVGDAEFQKKCLGRMETVSKSGRTILFVSHNMTMIQQLCERSILLSKGTIKNAGDTNSVIEHYLLDDAKKQTTDKAQSLGAGVSVSIVSVTSAPQSLADMSIDFELTSEKALAVDSIGFFVTNVFEERIGIIDMRKDIYELGSDGRVKFTVTIFNNPLIEGSYKLGLFLGSNLLNGNFSDILRFHVSSAKRSNKVVPYPVEVRGKVEFNYAFSNQ